MKDKIIRHNPVARLLKNFMEMEASSGITMIAFALIAMVLANSYLAPLYQNFIKLPVSLGLGTLQATVPLSVFVKDVFMVFFFLIVGLELKREMLTGFLSQKGQKILPLIAALGGIFAPAIVFSVINIGVPENASGWAIPTATDIAFALAVLTLVGSGISPSVKIFLLAIAIYDDLAAIVIIALFYGEPIQLQYLLVSLLVTGGLIGLNRMNVVTIMPYMILGIILWYFVHKTGIHTTISGVVVGMCIPLKSHQKGEEDETPLDDLIHILHPWVGFFILPLFAFVSSGVQFGNLNMQTLLAPMTIGIILALFLGKQIGIFLLTWGTVKLGIANKPQNATWLEIYAVSIIAGIGFTMSLFVGLLAFKDPIIQDEIRMGVIIGSLLSTIWGAIIMQIINMQKNNLINPSR